jgi:hypothetical protein
MKGTLLSSPVSCWGKNPIFRHIKFNISGTAKVKIVKNERDPPLFTGKLLIKYQNILEKPEFSERNISGENNAIWF